MKKKYFATLLCAAVLTAFTGCGESGALKEEKKAENKTEKLTFVLDWTPNTNHTGL